MGTKRQRGRRRPDAVEQLGAGEEHDAGAGERQQPPAPAGVRLEIVAPTFDRAQRDRIDHKPRFEARLDCEQPADLPEHRHR
jgi:hypothetical protein